ncbi:MAG: acetylxylan esterase [Deltaproteobacteria bacterium]
MNGCRQAATRPPCLPLVLVLVACSSVPRDHFEPPAPAPIDNRSSAARDSNPRASDASSTDASAGAVATRNEGMGGIIIAPIAAAEPETSEEGSGETSSVNAAGAAVEPSTPGMQLWQQKRAALLDIIERPRVPLDAAETPLADDAGLTVRDFSIATDDSTRINGTSFAPKLVGPLPAVIFLHGTGGSRQDGFGLLRTLAQRGFFALAIDARQHGAGIGQNPYFDAIYAAYVTGQGHPFLYDTVWDVMRLLDYLEQNADVDATRIGLVGNSKGGMETYLSAAIEPRIAAAVPWISVQSFDWGLDNNQWQGRVESIQGAFDQAAAHDGVPIDAGFVRQFYDRLVPGITTELDGPEMVAAIAPRPLLAVNGDMDPRTPMGGLRLCEASARVAYADVTDHFELYIEPNTGHAVTAEATARTVEWFVKWLE